ncbi:MAG TPA: helix-turn-helix transcriptional regulator [Pedobacter sp.]|jgi:transcriptional regulator with XRE-family HTH domain
MELHHGQTIERIIRRNGFSITELARLTNVNRRSVYNWFNQRHLKPEIIYRIGAVINHDLSTVFPSLYQYDEFTQADLSSNHEEVVVQEPSGEGNIWKDKYIELLERHNQLLLAHFERNSSTTTNADSV